jgi:hypothetical protein
MFQVMCLRRTSQHPVGPFMRTKGNTVLVSELEFLRSARVTADDDDLTPSVLNQPRQVLNLKMMCC